MNAVQLQDDILKLVKTTNDVSLLESIKNLLSNRDEVYILSDFEKNILAESAADYAKGNVISHEEVYEQNKQWLKGK